MSKHKPRLLLIAILAAMLTPSLGICQNVNQCDPSLVNEDNVSVIRQTQESRISSDDSQLVRNCLVVIGLGITFCVGMAITATTIQQNRPTTPQPTRFYAS